MRFYSKSILLSTLATVALSGAAQATEQSLLGSQAPATLINNDSVNYELGMKFLANVAGHITAIRFFKSPKERQGHTGKIYSAAGALLASAKFTSESASGWQEVNLPSPLAIQANVAYVVSVNTSKGFYVDRVQGLAKQISSRNLKGVAGGGVFGTVGAMPTKSWNNSNYFRDIGFVPEANSTQTATSTATATNSQTVTNTATSTSTTTTTSTSAYPDATNTGVPAGTMLTVHSGDMTVTTAGAVIDSIDLRGGLYVNANNVTVKRSRIRVSGYFQVKIADGVRGVTIEDCEVDGTGTNNDGSYGILGGGTFLRNNVHGVENGITPVSNTVIQDNYVHDLKASGDPHYDGIQIDGGQSNLVIRHNTIVNSNDQTSAVMIDNYFGAINNIVVDDNRLLGGGYTIYVDGSFNANAITNVSVTNNRIGTGGYGYTDFNKTNPVFTGNVDVVTGKPIQ